MCWKFAFGYTVTAWRTVCPHALICWLKVLALCRLELVHSRTFSLFQVVSATEVRSKLSTRNSSSTSFHFHTSFAVDCRLQTATRWVYGNSKFEKHLSSCGSLANLLVVMFSSRNNDSCFIFFLTSLNVPKGLTVDAMRCVRSSRWSGRGAVWTRLLSSGLFCCCLFVCLLLLL